MPQSPQPQDASDIFGSIIALLAVLYALITAVYEFFFKKKKPLPQHHQDEEEEEQEEEMAYEEEAVEEEEEHHTPSPPPLPKYEQITPPPPAWQQQKEHFVFHPHMDEFRQTSSIDERKLDIHLRPGEELVSQRIKMVPKYDVEKKKTESPLQDLFKKVPSKKSWIIFSVVIGPPTAMRKKRSEYW